MKTKMLFIAMAILLSSVQLIKAQDKEKRVYSYGWAYSYKSKYLFISPIVSATENRKGYVSPLYNVLAYQWQKRFFKVLDDYTDLSSTDFTNDVFVWQYDYDKIDDMRTEKIRKFKSEGFQVRYIDDFWYNQKKNDE